MHRTNEGTDSEYRVKEQRISVPSPLLQKWVNVGFGNIVQSARILGFLHADSAPTRRLRQEAKDSQRLIDMTEGRKTRTVILLDSNHVVLSAIQVETLSSRLIAPSVMDLEESDEKEA